MRFDLSLLSAASVAVLATALEAGASAGGAWVHLLPSGSFTSPRDGRTWMAGDRTALERVVANSLAIAGATELVVDYDHQSVFGAKDGVGGRAPAAGWVKQLEVRDDGIWGRVEWTEAASAAIRAQEYRYLSPVFLHDKAGKVLAIRMAALTNTPALDLTAVAASALLQTRDHSMDKFAAALGLPAGSGEDAVLAALNALLSATTAIAAAAGLAAGAKPADIQAAASAAFAAQGRIAQAAGLQAGATADQIVTSVASAVTGKVDPTKWAPIEAVTQLQADLKAIKDGTLAKDAETAVAAAIKDGKLAPALKDWGLDLFKADPAKFETFVGSAPVLTAPQLKVPNKGAADGTTLDAAQIAACSALGLDLETFKKTLAAEAAEQETR